MEDNTTELIEQYLQGALTGDQLRAVENRLRTDSAFRRAVDVQRAVVRQVRNVGRSDLRERLKRIEAKVDLPWEQPNATAAVDSPPVSLRPVPENSSFFRRYAVAASVALALLIGSLFYLRSTKTDHGPELSHHKHAPPRQVTIPFLFERQERNLGFSGNDRQDSTIVVLLYASADDLGKHGSGTGRRQYQFDDTLRLYGPFDPGKLSLQYDRQHELYTLRIDTARFPMKRSNRRSSLPLQ